MALTRREREMLQFAGEALDDREIAERMAVTTTCISVMFDHIYDEYGIEGNDRRGIRRRRAILMYFQGEGLPATHEHRRRE